MISLEQVHLYYPLNGIGLHSLQLTLYNKIHNLFYGTNCKENIEYIHALKNLTLHIEDGNRLGIIGHNGAGKTTLLRVISGVYPPTSGKIKVAGKISAMTDFTLGMDPNVSGIQNIIFRLVFMGYSYKEAEAAVEEIVQFAELGEFINLPVRIYSTGMFLRLAFAISTHFKPDILVLDEVIGAGDESFREKALRRLDELINGARIVVLSSHDLGAIEKYCTSTIVMAQGEIVYQGDPKQAIEYYRSLCK